MFDTNVIITSESKAAAACSPQTWPENKGSLRENLTPVPYDAACNLAQREPQHEDELMTIAHQLEQKRLETRCMEGRKEGKM